MPSSMEEINTTLPDHVPEMSQDHSSNGRLNPFALYILADCLDDLPTVLEVTNSLCPTNDYVKPAPHVAFPGSDLKQVIDYHISLGFVPGYDYRWFLAVTSTDWRKTGILIVTLDDDDMECKPDAFFIKPEDSGIVLVNLQVGNTDWYEVKESHEIGNEPELPPDYDSEDTFPDGAPKKKPGTGYYIAFYAIPGIDAKELIQTVQPAPQQPEADYCCRFEGYLKPEVDPARQAMTSWHPQACMSNPYLHKSMFFVADTEDYNKNGLLLCNVKGEKTKRVECNVHTLVPDFVDIFLGQRKWDD